MGKKTFLIYTKPEDIAKILVLEILRYKGKATNVETWSAKFDFKIKRHLPIAKKKKKWKWYTNEKDIITKLYNLASKNYSSIRDMVGDKKMDLKKDLVKKLSLINKKSVWKHRKNISWYVEI